MKPLSLLCCLLCCTIFVSAQYEGELYAFNKNWQPEADLFKAQYIMNLVKGNDTTYVCRYYHKNGPMIKWETYRDSSLEIPHGRFAWYNAKGTIDSTGWVYNGKKDKDWLYLPSQDSLRFAVEELYHKGRLEKRTDHRTKTITYANGLTEPLPPYNHFAEDTLTHKRASFVGGIKGWVKYLEKNLKSPDRFRSLYARDTKAPTYVSFIIDTTGAVSDIFLLRSFEWSVDTETIRVLKTSPRWVPATINGEKVIYRHRQTITFVNW